MEMKNIDILNREKFIDQLEQILQKLSEEKQGAVFAIDGTWGLGKTFILECLEDRLKPFVNEETYDDRYYIFHYNCWQYDYYEEPSIAIISAMLEQAENNTVSKTEKIASAGWEKAKDVLGEIAQEYCKNRIGIDLVGIVKDVRDNYENDQHEKYEFDNLFTFKKTLDKTREKMKTLTEEKTVVLVVDEIDRCMPEYAIKVLERLHHIFDGMKNFIVVIAVDSKQLNHSIRKIFGQEMDTDRYLKKFIRFTLRLNEGVVQPNIKDRFLSYFSCFNEYEVACTLMNELIDALSIDIRNIIRILENNEFIHKLIFEDKQDEAILWFELIWSLVRLKVSDTVTNPKKLYLDNWYWLPEINKATYVSLGDVIGENALSFLKETEKKAESSDVFRGMPADGIAITNDINGRAWYLLDCILAEKKALYCNCFANKTEIVEKCKRFIELSESMC